MKQIMIIMSDPPAHDVSSSSLVVPLFSSLETRSPPRVSCSPAAGRVIASPLLLPPSSRLREFVVFLPSCPPLCPLSLCLSLLSTSDTTVGQPPPSEAGVRVNHAKVKGKYVRERERDDGYSIRWRRTPAAKSRGRRLMLAYVSLADSIPCIPLCRLAIVLSCTCACEVYLMVCRRRLPLARLEETPDRLVALSIESSADSGYHLHSHSQTCTACVE